MNRKITTISITVVLLSLTFSSLFAIPVDAAKTSPGTVTITVNLVVNGRQKPVEGATVTIRDTNTQTGTTDRRGQISFFTANIVAEAGTKFDYWYDATYTDSNAQIHTGCMYFLIPSSNTAFK